MALWICSDCTTAYSVGALYCPQCGSEEYSEEGAFVGETGAKSLLLEAGDVVVEADDVVEPTA